MFVYTLLVFFCSFLYGLSAVLCKYGLQHNVDVRTLSFRAMLPFLVRNKIWILGVLLSFATNFAIVELQSFIDVSVVYPILNFSYIFVLLLGHYFLNEVLNNQQWVGVVAVIVGTILIIFIEDPTTGTGTDLVRLFMVNAVSLAAIGYMIFTVYREKIENYEIYFATCTGIAFGNVETYIKANTNLVIGELGHFSIFSMESLVYFISMWPFFMLLLFGTIGWICMQITYSHGNVPISVPLFAVIQSCITLTCGFFIFGELLSLQKLFGIITIVTGVLILIFSTIDEAEVRTV